MQIFTSGALPTGDYRYWILVIFVGGTIASSLLIMFLIIIFETMRAFRYSKLYQEVRCVPFLTQLFCMLFTCSPCNVICVVPRINSRSDYTESKMVRRVTTNAAGNKAMQMLFGRQHLAKAASENKVVLDLGPNARVLLQSRVSMLLLWQEVGDGNGSSGSGDGVQMNPMARADRLKKLNSPVKPVSCCTRPVLRRSA